MRILLYVCLHKVMRTQWLYIHTNTHTNTRIDKRIHVTILLYNSYTRTCHQIEWHNVCFHKEIKKPYRQMILNIFQQFNRKWHQMWQSARHYLKLETARCLVFQTCLYILNSLGVPKHQTKSQSYHFIPDEMKNFNNFDYCC